MGTKFAVLLVVVIVVLIIGVAYFVTSKAPRTKGTLQASCSSNAPCVIEPTCGNGFYMNTSTTPYTCDPNAWETQTNNTELVIGPECTASYIHDAYCLPAAGYGANGPTCPVGYMYTSVNNGHCVPLSSCPSLYSYNQTLGKCLSITACPSGYNLYSNGNQSLCEPT